MLRFWLEVFGRALVGTFAAIGKDPAEIRFSIIVLVLITALVFVTDGVENGWLGMGKRLSALGSTEVQLVAVLCFLVFVYNLVREPFLMWHSENANYIQLDKDFNQLAKNANTCSSDLKTEQATSKLQHSQLDSQQGIINSQQGTVNSLESTLSKQQGAVTTCVGDLAKAIVPEPSKTSILLLPTREEHTTKHVAYLILLTNKPVTPVHLTVWCDAYVHQFEAIPADGSAFGGGTEKTPDGTAATVFLTFPTWTAENPLLIKVHYDSDDLGRCYFKPL